MGAWGPALFSDDLACDVRGDYRQQLEDGVEDERALAVTLERYRSSLADDDEGPIVILALAVTVSRFVLDAAVEHFHVTGEIGAFAVVRGSERFFGVFLAPRAERVVACTSVRPPPRT